MRWEATGPAGTTWTHVTSWWLLVGAAVALSLVGNLAMAARGSARAGLPWWLAALALLALAAWSFDRTAPVAPQKKWRTGDTAALGAVLALALLTRLWRVGEYPPPDAFAFEEFQAGSVAYRVLRGGSFPWEFPLTHLAPVPTMAVIGLDAWGLRLPFLIGGVAAPLFLFLALRRLVSLPAAAAATSLFAAARWPAAAARFADEIFFPVWVVALSLCLLVRGAQRWRQKEILLSALVMGDLFYAHTAYRGFPPVAFASALVVAAARARRCGLPPGALRHVVLVAATWALLLGPGLTSRSGVFGEGFRRHAAGWAAAPEEARSLRGRLQQVWERLGAGVGVFLIEGDTTANANIPGEPMLDPVTGPLALLAVVLAAWHWRQPWRGPLAAAVVLTFFALAILPINLYVGRFFVLLVPLFTLIAFALEDLVRWRRAPRWTPLAVSVGAALVAAYNFHGLHRLIEDPRVKESFLVPENTILAAVHEAPRGARVVLLTLDCTNALDESDYTWYSAHLRGGPAESLAAALAVDPREASPIRWITQGTFEAELLPELVALVCPDAAWRLRPAPSPMATVASVQVPNGHRCTALPAAGLSATYTIEERDSPRVVSLIDPALMAHTIPVHLAWQVQDRRVLGLQVEWRGALLPPVAGSYRIQLDLLNAAGSLTVGEAQAELPVVVEGEWQSASLSFAAETAPVPLRVELEARPGLRPSVRLFWEHPGAGLRLIPPQALRPDRLLTH